METWQFDYDLLESFVEREHSENDVIGENIVPENLEMGEYMSSNIETTGKVRDFKIVVACTFDEDGNDVSGGTYGKIYSGLRYHVYNSADEVNEWLDGFDVAKKQDGIVSMFMMPSAFISELNSNPKGYDITIQKHYDGFGGEWTPNNNKLYTYPYNFLYVSNLEGNSAVMPYEFFSTDDCVFSMVGDMSCNPGIIIYPMNYKGAVANFDEKLLLSGFPQCSYVTDTYKAWLAQTALPQAPNMWVNQSTAFASGVLSIIGGLAMTNPVTGTLAVAGGMLALGSSAVKSITTTISEVYKHAIMPDQAHGYANGYTQFASSIKEFMFVRKHISEYYAKLIDKYFDCYGYATNMIKVPNIKSRPYYNFVKTVSCNIVGEMPSDDIANICKIYDYGITFWHYRPNDTEFNHVGNYSVPNKLR